ncbi:uncharacterized protein LOC129943482 isoform X1 [Eupeodes corollae]|uniref:uncharacterized protein LOC129943482 isoform X1 n=1 Tax=Eupeodes corollae TaxID=290404 RepID=UPI00248F692F|nr:uncharacterized protein LOC129943482 isoform X1 [Eupeodes corollae]
MSPLALTIFTFLIFDISKPTYGSEIPSNITCGGNSLLSGNIDGTQIMFTNDNTTDNRTVKRPIFATTTTSSPIVFQPTPADPSQPIEETTTMPIDQPISMTLPTNISLPPPASTTEPHAPVSICGKMGNCYRWFDDQWALELSGYKRCEPRDERRAIRYCCIPPPKAAF